MTHKSNAEDAPVMQATEVQHGGAGGLAKLGRMFPTAIVLSSLAALGYWGHRTGWKMPSFSELTDNVPTREADWCAEHSVPEAICVACHADFMPKGELHGWCQEHGVAECVWEHPELAQLAAAPEVSQADLERAHRALDTKERSKNDPLCKLHLRRIQFASRAAADKTGVDIALVDRAPITEVLTATGEVQYDPTRLARLSSRADGTVWRVEKNIGDRVQAGDILAYIDAAAVGRAKAELLQAVAQLELQQQTLQRLSGLEGVVTVRRIQESEAARADAEGAIQKGAQALGNLGLPIRREEIQAKTSAELSDHLEHLGLPAKIRDELQGRQSTANLIPVVAPREGLVVARDVVAGEVIDTARTLFTVVDTSNMWLLLDVPLEDVQHVKVGQQVVFRPDGGTHDHGGHIHWISTDVDAETRTVKVRAELPNDEGQLRNESFGAGRVVLREETGAIVAPREAIHWEGCCHVAFVRDKDFFKEGSYKVFHTRMVRLGVTDGDRTEVIAGLLPGEVIASKGSAVLRAELLKGNLGAG